LVSRAVTSPAVPERELKTMLGCAFMVYCFMISGVALAESGLSAPG